MAEVYEITAEPPKLTLDPRTRSGDFVLRITNRDDKRRRGMLSVVPLDDAQKDWPKDWLTVEGHLQHDFDAGETEPYTIKLSIPSAVKAGSYRIQPKVEDEERPDTHSATGPILEFVVPELDQPPPPKWWPYAVAAAVVLALGVILFLLLSRVEVPSLVGTNIAVAKPTLEASGLQQGASQPAVDAQATPGTILGQTPVAGERVSRGTSVDLVVSQLPTPSPTVVVPATPTPPPPPSPTAVPPTPTPRPTSTPATIRVPRVTGLTVSDARATIDQSGLRVGSVSPTGGFASPPPRVISQDPPAGSQVARGTAVDLSITRTVPPGSEEP